MIIAVYPWESKYLVLDNHMGSYIVDELPPIDHVWNFQGVTVTVLKRDDPHMIAIRYEKNNSHIVVGHMYYEGKTLLCNSIYLTTFDDYDLMGFVLDNHPKTKINDFLRRYHETTLPR